MGKIFAGDIRMNWVWDDRQSCFCTDALHYAQVRERLHEKLKAEVVDSLESSGQFAQLRMPQKKCPPLREDQRSAATAWLAAGGRGLVVMPTGTGKTVVATDLILHHQRSTLVIVPIRDLMYQWHARLLEATGIDWGIIGDGVYRVSPFSVTTYDSAAIHMPRIGDRFHMIVFDEVHHLAGDWRSDAARMSAATQRLGLTATMPSSEDRIATLHDLVGPTVYRDSIRSARGRTLAEYRVRRLAVQLNETERRRYQQLSQVVQHFVADRRKEDPRFEWQQIYALVAEDAEARRCLRAYRLKRRIEERAAGKMRVLEDLFRLHQTTPIIVFVGSNAMAREISLRFLVPCLLSHCGKRERAEVLRGFAEGAYPVLVANRVLDEGVDLPEVKVAIVIGGTASERQATQRLGRILRKSGQRDAVLYEIVTDATGEVERSRTRRRSEAYQSQRQSGSR